jgi:outer membrane immunogenic protein
MKRVLLTAGALAVFAFPAMAADLPARAPVYKSAPPVVAAFSWTGCYVGANVGGAWSKQDANEYTIPVGFNVGPGYVSTKSSGWIGGAQAGCNYQFGGGVVVGIEGDWSGTKLDGSSAAPNVLLNGTPAAGGIAFNENTKSLATIRGRLGYAVAPSVLLYVTGGGAWSRTDYTGLHTYVTGCPNCSATSFTSNKSGWVFGGGAEWALWNSNWIARAEALYYSFGGANSFGLQAATGATTTAWNWGNLSIVEARVGISYKFGGPVVANY